MNELGTVVVSFFEDHLKVQKGLRPSSIRSYRDVIKLFLNQIASRHHCPITRLALTDITSGEVLEFLKSLEDRGNLVRTRNQRLAGLRTFFRYLASRAPEALAEAERVEAIPVKRCAPPHTYYLERDEVEQLLASIRTTPLLGLRDRGILTLMYNTGARVQEIADLRVQDVDLDGPYRVRLHGKGGQVARMPDLARNGKFAQATRLNL
jgi:integrase/recombinase XerD